MNSVSQSSRPKLPMFRGKSPVTRGLTCVALALAFLGFFSASAQALDRVDHHYKRALKYYESKDYPTAIKEFQAAYRVRQLPKILLNIGQVYRKLGMASTALKFYQHYLRVEPNPKAEIKAEVDRYIAQTQAMLDPPDFVTPGGQSAAEAAAAEVAAAPSNVTPVTVPEHYTDEDLQSLSQVPQRDAKGRVIRHPLAPPGTPVDKPLGVAVVNPPPSTQPSALPLIPTQPQQPMPPQKTPVYKEPWFWGLIGGIAGAVIITGAAVGAQRSNSLPPEILHPTK
jgi:hypothetical protein